MRLKQLKLAGFKSFVDPTVVPFPSQLVAVVGPNGCGKSNIIDAVRWVLGESSAKNLRGESMTDVIFNGSSGRKAVGQASVELIFDNHMGRLSGPYGSYTEISVKRLVSRDGESSYYLNNTRCRRRDITDIFLGTGAGARGYSIIGQGTISKIVEARPEELRAYLEEAAGVSKYRERRRETVQRIEHTRDNLARVSDVRDEIDKQLKRLERQARTAERYQALKVEEHRCRADILARKYQILEANQKTCQDKIIDLSKQYTEYQHQNIELDAKRDTIMLALHEEQDRQHEQQEQFYQLGTKIARLEQEIVQSEREQQQILANISQLEQQLETSLERIRLDEEAKAKMAFEQASLQIEVEESQLALDSEVELLQQYEDKQHDIQKNRQEISERIAATQHEHQIKKMRHEHLSQHIAANQERVFSCLEKRDLLNLDELKQQMQSHRQSIDELDNRIDDRAKKIEQLSSLFEDFEQINNQLVHEAETKLTKIHQLNIEIATLEGAIKSASGKVSHDAPDERLLFKQLAIEEPWQAALECVLGRALMSQVCMDEEQALTLIRQSKSMTSYITDVAVSKNSLASKVIGDIPATTVDLSNIYCVISVDEALSQLSALKKHESLITIDGVWMGHGWCLAPVTANDEDGLLVKQSKLLEYQNSVKISEISHENIKEQQRLNLDKLTEVKQQLFDANQEQLRDVAEKQSLEILFQRAQSAFENTTDQVSQITLEIEELTKKIKQLTQELGSLSFDESHDEHLTHLNDERLLLEELFLQQQSDIQSLRIKVNEKRQQLHEHERSLSVLTVRQQEFKERIMREQQQQQERQQQHAILIQKSFKDNSPVEALTHELQEAILAHEHLTDILTLSRTKVEDLKNTQNDIDRQIRDVEHHTKKLNDSIGQLRIDEQSCTVKMEHIQEQAVELDVSLEDAIGRIDVTISLDDQEKALVNIHQSILSLGAINLAAIDEFMAEQERKQFIDTQMSDLEEALNALETAIARMDKETAERLKQTFDEVNQGFKHLFPKLFGGGRAELTLTSDNILEAGMLVMAQPPGKRNSTIHLLSGGEKAMTAVALVFAIFQLNPSPFCMLDEVDAPLDDVNVGRFCQIVREMSEYVQFLFITHNKVTMELATHLMGVTMREPGVSRLVAVDVEQALILE